jgi:hypothetical protein
MRKVSVFLAVLLLSGVCFGKTKVLRGDASAPGEMVMSTIEDTIYYVRTTGNDSNDCLTTGTACLTIQEAIDRIPYYVKHAVTVDVGTGSFAGFNVGGRMLDTGGLFTIQGTLGDPTLATGTVSGTATGGTTLYLDDSGQSWTTNDLVGHYLSYSTAYGTEYRIIRSNTATRINVLNAFDEASSGKAYTIVEPKTALTSASAAGAFINLDGIIIAGASAWYVRNFVVNDPTWFGVRVRHVGYGIMSRMRVDMSGSGGFGIVVSDTEGTPVFEEVSTNDGSVGGIEFINSDVGVCSAYVRDSGGSGLSVTEGSTIQYGHILATGNGESGVVVSGLSSLSAGNVYADSNTGSGISVLGPAWVKLSSGTASSNGGSGLAVDSGAYTQYSGSVVSAGTLTMASNGASAVKAQNRSQVYLQSVTGTSNTGYGIEVECDSTVRFKSSTTVTGTVSDATVDEGSTGLTYASNFTTDRDVVIDANLGTRLERKD